MIKFDFNPKNLERFFDNKVREACRSCKRYGCKATCPPYTESVEYYKKNMPLYKYGMIVYDVFTFKNTDDWKELGRNSSLAIHSELLSIKNILFNEGHYLSVAFTAGSCKLCESCQFPCRNPSKSLIPLEATGLNVVHFMKYFGINIAFPIKDELCRIGIVLYD
jgi:predicted metal-binding protein